MASTEKGLNSERRKYPRFNIDFQVKYNSRSKLFSKYGRAINASEGGLLVRLPEEMTVGQRLPLKLFFPSGSELNIIAPSVQVVWTGIHLKEDYTWDYRTGVRFVDIPPKDMIKYKNFLMSFKQEPLYTS
jgi:c-di-GMP-binding flagellar brake protein YcgR